MMLHQIQVPTPAVDTCGESLARVPTPRRSDRRDLVPPRRRDRDHNKELYTRAYPRSSNGMWSIKLFAPSGTSSSSPSNSGVNTS